MKKFKLLCAVISITILSTMPVYAGWEQTGATWKYQNTDKTYMTNTWAWLDGNNDGISECYYFGADGIMLSNATTADGYLVNADGQWIVNGIVQTKAAGAEKSNNQPQVENNVNGPDGEQGQANGTQESTPPPSSSGGGKFIFADPGETAVGGQDTSGGMEGEHR